METSDLPARTKPSKSAASSAEIVAAATRVLARKGFARTSLMDIAKEANMSKGALHYHFPSKEALLTRVLEACLNTIAARTLSAWAQNLGSPLDAVRSAIKELWTIRRSRTDEIAVIADLLAQSLHDEGLRPHLANYYRFAAQQVELHLDGQLKAVGLRPKVQASLIPRLLVGLLDGMVMQHFVDNNAIEDEELYRAIEAMTGSLFEFAG